MYISLLISKIEAKQSVFYDKTQSKPLICKDFTLVCLLFFRDSYWFDSISDLEYPCLNTFSHLQISHLHQCEIQNVSLLVWLNFTSLYHFCK